jgi:beta-fructofuranosidase
VTWDGDRYHLFYQAVPGRVTWAPNCHWGHATSRDLIEWTEHEHALVPQPYEVGCWSGSVVADGVNAPTIFYTRVAGDDWGQGRVAVAHGGKDLRTWSTGPDDVVVEPPHLDVGVHAFRDPFVLRTGDEWVMLVGAGFDDGSAGILQYRSADLREWAYEGVICERAGGAEDEVWTGALWECPQLVEIGGRWVLIVSVWDADVLYYVAAAIGSYDGHRFVPERWQQLTHGRSAYALSSFRDREGRPCAFSWLREEPQNDPDLVARAGAHSLPAVLDVSAAGRIVLRPHPNVDQRRRPLFSMGGQDVLRFAASGAVDLEVPTAAGLEMRVAQGALTLRQQSDGLRVERVGLPDEFLPQPAPSDALRVVVDADLVEVFGADAYGAYRIPGHVAAHPNEVTVRGADPRSVRSWCL